MPELPDITVYIEALEQRVLGHVLERIQIAGPSLLRTADPPIAAAENRSVAEIRRVGKRIAFGLDSGSADDERLWLVLHLMIAGRLHWSDKRKMPDGRRVLAAFDFDNGTLTLTEAGTRKRVLFTFCTVMRRSRIWIRVESTCWQVRLKSSHGF